MSTSMTYYFDHVPISIIDVFWVLLFIVFILTISSAKKAKMIRLKGNEHYKYYLYNVYFKLFFTLAFAAIYLLLYGGGDTTAYYNGAANLNNLFWSSPTDYLTEMNTTPGAGIQMYRFTPETGYPPGWIYRDPNSFFISKVISIFMLFLGQSYLLISILLGWLLSKISWRIYELVLYYKITTEWLGAISVLFIPSVAFWCSGISKDTIVLLCVFYILHYTFGIANKTLKNNTFGLFFIFLSFYVLMQTRSFMVFTVAGPLFIALSTRVVRKYKESPFIANLMKFFIFSFSVVALLVFLKFQGEEIAQLSGKYLAEAQVQQDDFKNNVIYGSKKYDLGITDFSPIGMLKTAPLAVLTAFYRPGIWEARSPLLLISGIETSIFIFLTFYFFFKGKFIKKINTIRNNELLMFSLVFALILGFFAGFTSILFGVLVRIKAPLLPFLLMVLTVRVKKLKDS